MSPPHTHVISAMLWWATLIGLVIDTVFVVLLLRYLAAKEFKHLKWPLVITSGVFWAAMWLFLTSTIYWDSVACENNNQKPAVACAPNLLHT